MYIRTKENQQKHDSGVATWAVSYVKGGWSNVLSDLPGNVKPPKINGHIPDIYASHGNAERVVEIETQDSVNSEHARQQVVAFQAWARMGQNRKFEVKVV
ncbi:MAG: hypothetical protein HYX20_00050 [Candidatus Yanofskybacteria bacterium]|nr:hypothetical protein [Candidatus Yanofskybacteria bacterium]